MAPRRLPDPLAEFLRFVRAHRLVPRGSRVIAAVSGGADSMGLLQLLLASRSRLGVTVEVAHVDHRLRGRAAAADAAFVRRAAARLALPFHLGRGRRFTAAERRARSLQELAREVRIGFLLRLARRRRALVAFGHTADDQAETFLIRLLAGGGPAALGGIPPASHGGRLIHPLLGLRRAALRGWLRALGVPHREDPTNRSDRWLRNRIRRGLLPLLARNYNPRVVERLCSVAALLRRDAERLDEEAAELLARAAAQRREIRFSAGTIAAAHPAVLARALLAAARRLAGPAADLTSAHLEALLAPGAGGRRFDLPGGITALRDRRGIALGPSPAPVRPLPPAALPLPGRAAVGPWRLSARLLRCPRGFDPRAFAAAGGRVALDAGKVLPPLTVRGRREGDRFQPLGLPAAKRLKEFLIDAGVPAAERGRLPLVCDRGGILWIGGLRPAERGRVTGATRRLLLLTLAKVGPDRPGPRPDDAARRPRTRAAAGPRGRRAAAG